MRYAMNDLTAEGVPLKMPLAGSNANPAGNEGTADQDVTVPPVLTRMNHVAISILATVVMIT